MTALAFALALSAGAAPDEGNDDARVDAQTSVEVWVADPAGPRRVLVGEPFRSGDRVQIVVHHPRTAWVTVAGSDDRGVVEIYASWRARAPGGPAPFALQLDDSPGEQRLYTVFSSLRRPTASVLEMLVEARASAGTWVRSITLRKASPRSARQEVR